MKHKNTVASLVAGGITSASVWLAKRYAGYDLTPAAAAIIASSAISAVLFVGRRGIRGTALTLWNGGLLAWNGTEKSKSS